MKVAFINGFPHCEFYYVNKWYLKLQALAGNPGNWIYVNELKKQIDFKEEFKWFDDLSLLTNDYTVGIMPVSNMLRSGYDRTTEWADLIDKLNFPIVLIGLGTQSIAGQMTPKDIVSAMKPEVIKAFQRIAYQCYSLGIRGEATAECLDLMGIHNYRIIGCPSFYQYLDGCFVKRKKPTLDKIVFNLEGGRKIAGKIFKMGMRNNGYWIMQGMHDGVKYLYSDELVSNEYAQKILYLNKAGERENDYIKNNAKIFFTQEEWEQFLRDDFTFSFGMRFHGNMIAHLSGIPTVWIGHDIRTKELISALKLPGVSLEEYKTINDIETLIEKCDYSKTEQEYHSMCVEYVRFLEENKIKHKFNL